MVWIMNAKKEIVLSLISHTNIGKTTLARTLLRRDVGEVRDEAHVTDESTAYTMLETPNEALILWDTPGFGNVAALLKRLKAQGGAWGWLMHEVVDRVFNRSLYSSLEATKNVKNRAEVVLYLVNVRERPGDAGYIQGEMTLLEALGKPVIMILNQVDSQELASPKERTALERRWKTHFQSFKCLKEVLVLDAFIRTWQQELRLIQALEPLVSDASKKALANLAHFHANHQAKIFKNCATLAADLLWQAKNQQIDPDSSQNPRALFEALVADLQNRLDAYLDALMKIHQIEADGRAKFKTDLQQVTGQKASRLDEKKSGFLAGAIGSAGSGLMADVLSGGLTFGGGAILGFLGGYFGGLSYAKMMNLRTRGRMTWRQDTLIELFQLLIIYFLVAAHHGRGKGKLHLEEPLQFIVQAADQSWEPYSDALKSLLKRAADDSESTAFRSEASLIFQNAVNDILAKLYPEDPDR